MPTSIIKQPEQPAGSLWWQALRYAYPPLATIRDGDLPGASLAVRLFPLESFQNREQACLWVEDDLSLLFPLLRQTEVRAAQRCYVLHGEGIDRGLDDLEHTTGRRVVPLDDISLAAVAGWYSHKGEVLGGILHLYRPGERQRPRIWDANRMTPRPPVLKSRLEPAVLLRTSTPSELEEAARHLLLAVGLPRGIDDPAKLHITDQITVGPYHAGALDDRLLNQLYTQVSALPYSVDMLPGREASEGICGHALVLQPAHRSLQLVAHALGGTWRYRQPVLLLDVLAESRHLLPSMVGLVLSHWQLSHCNGLRLNSFITWMDAGTLSAVVEEAIAEAARAWRYTPNEIVVAQPAS